MLSASLVRVLSSPTAADVWKLRSDLLEAGVPPTAEVWEVLDELHRFLGELATGTSSRDFSELASKMDISAISGVLVEHLLEQHDARELAVRVFSGILSEGLMVLATRQHVKAWAGELAAVHRGAAWYLYQALWRWAERLRPEVAPAERRQLLDRLFTAVHSADTPDGVKAALLGRLFQVLLVSHLTAALAGLRTTGPEDSAQGGFSETGVGCNNRAREKVEDLDPAGAGDGEEKE